MWTQLERRPLLLALAALGVGIASRSQFLDLFLLIPILFLARSLRSWSIAALFLFVGYLIAPEQLPVLSVPTFVQGPIQITSEAEDRINSVQCTGYVSGFQVLISTPVGTHLHRGDVLAGEGLISPVSESEESFDLDQGIQGKMNLNPIVFIRHGWRIFGFTDKLKDDFRSYVSSFAPSDTAVWIDALWLRGGPLPKSDRDELAASGAYSLVAASGLHVFVLWGLFSFVFGSLIGLDRRVQIVVIGGALAIYCLITGLHESTFRASVTCMIISTAYLFKREPDVVSATALCGLVYLLLFPRLLPSLGFQLSMVVPIALGFYLPSSRLMFQGKSNGVLARRLRQAACVVLVVFLSSQPLIAFHTGRFGFGMLLSSFSLAIASPIVLTATIGVFFLKFLVPSAALGLTHLLVVPLVDGFRFQVGWIAQTVPSFSIPTFGWVWLFVYFALWLIVWREREIPA